MDSQKENSGTIDEGFTAVLEADTGILKGIRRVKNFIPSVVDLYENGEKRGKSSGWRSMDQWWTVQLSELTVVTGMPGSGKSSWVDTVMLNLSVAYGWKWGVLSPENHPHEAHIRKFAEKYIRKPFFGYNRISPDELTDALRFLDEKFYFIHPGDDYTLKNILNICRLLSVKEEVSGILIDPWNELEHRRPSTMSETEYISLCLTEIRRFARFFNLHFFVIAHPAKLRKIKDSEEYPVPTPYDISGSAHWRNKADNCIAVHRPDINHDLTEIHVQKVRHKWTGKAGGCIELTFNRETEVYHERT